MCTKWYFDNLVLDANVSPSTENAQFPASNIADPRRTKVFRSLADTAHVYFDFGAAEEIDSVILVDHTLHGFGIATASLELNTVASWSSGAPVTIPITVDDANGIAFGKHSSVVNYRYAKLILTSDLDYCELSKVFIGKERVISAVTDFDYPLGFKRNSAGTKTKNRYNQTFVDEVATFRSITGALKVMTNDEMDVISELDKICSNVRPFFLRFDSGEVELLNDNDEMSGYFMLANEISFQKIRGNYWETGQMTFEEAG